MDTTDPIFCTSALAVPLTSLTIKCADCSSKLTPIVLLACVHRKIYISLRKAMLTPKNRKDSLYPQSKPAGLLQCTLQVSILKKVIFLASPAGTHCVVLVEDCMMLLSWSFLSENILSQGFHCLQQCS